MVDNSYLGLAARTADRMEALDNERSAIVEAISDHSDTNKTLKEWGQVIYDRGQLRKRDDLRIEPTRFAEWKFTPTSSDFVYVDGLVHVVVYRDGVADRAEIRVREYLKNVGGVVSRWVSPDADFKYPSVYISQTNAPEKARQIINEALRESWEYMQTSLAEIWSEAVAYQVMMELRNNRLYAARQLIAKYGEVK
jgi:hypothetical protein